MNSDHSDRYSVESLRKKKDFQAVFRNGKRFFSPYGMALFLFRTDASVRVGIVIGVKTAKKAVTRNRIRRRIREALRVVLQEHPSVQGIDMIILPKATALDAPFEMLKKEMVNMISKISNQPNYPNQIPNFKHQITNKSQ